MKTSISGINGYDVEIYTGKGYGGKIVCMAQFGTQKQGEGYTTFSFEMYGDPRILLASSAPDTRATEKAIQTIHRAGLAKFEEMKAAGTLPTRKDPFEGIKPGQIAHFHGYGKEAERLAIYEIDKNSGFKCVNLDTLALVTHSHIKNIEDKKAGIGIYYREGETVDQETLNKALSEARTKREADDQEKKEKAAAAAEQRKKDIETGAAKLPAIPAGITHVIVAEHRVNKSDPMSDYFNYETDETHYLAFSRTDRNLFEEMRKAAKNSPNPEINKYATKPGEGEREDEHRENYSGGAGYYLGQSKYSGWVIVKKAIKDAYWAVKLEDMQIAIAQNRYFIPDQDTTPEPTRDSLPNLKGDIQIIDYSEKAIVVKGEGTRAIKDKLKALGGRFNFRLSCGAGWVFPKTKTDDVCALLEKIGALEPQTEEVF